MQVSLVFDSRPAQQGAREYEQATDRISQAARRMGQELERVQRIQGTGSQSRAVQEAQQQIAAIDRVTQARQREAATERQVAADRARSAREQSRADAERLRSRQQAERAALTALSTLGGENRALAQRIRFEQRLTQAVNEGVISQQRANALRQQANTVFSTAAVNARDLRLNMQGLNQSVALLQASFARFGPVATSALAGISRAIANAKEEIALFVANSNLPSGAGGGGSAFPGGFGAGAAGGAAARTPGLGTRVLAGLGGPAGLAGLAAAGGTAFAVTQLVQASNDLESAFDEVSAITGIVGDDLARLTDESIRLSSQSRGTIESATQVAEAFKLIASADPALASSAESLGEVTRAAILLADASGDELSAAVNTTLSSLAQFGEGADQAARFVDALAAGAKVGAIEVPQLGRVVAEIGATARDAGLGFEDLVALIETAGRSRQPLDIVSTSLRNIILNLQLTGRLRRGDNIADVLQKIGEEGLTSSEILDLFGRRAITTGRFLLGEVQTLRQYQEGVRENGVALEQANTRLDNFSGASKRAGAAFGGFIDALAQTGPIKEIRDAITGATDDLSDFFAVATGLVQGKDRADIFASLFSPDEIKKQIEETKQALEDLPTIQGPVTFIRGRLLQSQLEALQQSKEIQAAAAAAASSRAGDATPDTGSDRAFQNASDRVAELIQQYDKATAASDAYHKAETDLANAVRLHAIEEDKAARLLAIIRDATIGKTKADKDEKRVLEEKARAEAAWAEEVRKADLAQQESENRAEARVVSIETENERLRQQIAIHSQGELAIAALNAEYRIQDELLRKRKEIGGPLSAEDVQRIRDAVKENERLKVVLGQVQTQTDAMAKRIADRIEHLGDNIHDALAGSIRSALDESGNLFDDFFDRILNLGKDVFAQLAASAILTPGVTLDSLGSLLKTGQTFGQKIPSSEDTTSERTAKESLEQSKEQTGILQRILGAFGMGEGSGGGGGDGFLSSISGSLGGLTTALGLGGLAGGLISSGLDKGLNTEGGINRLSSGIGAGIGLLAYSGAIVSAILTGSTAGSVVPIIGTLIGAALGAVVGILINAFQSGPRRSYARVITSQDPNDPRFSEAFFTTPSDPSGPVVSRESPFGFIGLDAAIKQKLGGDDAFIANVQKFDFAISSFLTRRQTEIAAEALQNVEALTIGAKRFTSPDFAAVLANRVRIIETALLEQTDLPIGAITGPNSILGNDFGQGGTFGITDLSDPQKVIDSFQGFTDSLKALEEGLRFLKGEEITQSAQKLKDLEDTFQKLGPVAIAFGIDLGVLEDALAQGTEKLRTDFLEGFADRTLAIEDPLAAALKALSDEREQALKEATDLGVETVLLERYYLLQREEIIKQFFEQANGALQSFIDQATGSTSSPLAPQEALSNAESRFAEQLLAAQAGDLEARDALAQTARDLLDIRESLFGATEQFFTGPFGFNAIIEQIQALIDTLPTGLDLSGSGLAGGDPLAGTGGTGSGGTATVVQGVVEIPGVSTEAMQVEMRDEIEDLRTVVVSQAADIKAMRTQISQLVSLLEQQQAAA